MAASIPIGTRIQRRRQALGMRQQDLAKRLGVSKQTVSYWESGKHFPVRYLGAIEEALGINLEGELQADPVPPEVREAIYRTLPPDRAARIEAVVEAALRGEPLPVSRRGEPPAKAG